MRLIIITPPTDIPDEISIVCRILEQTCAIIHLRKPGRHGTALAGYLERIPGGLHGRIMVHDESRLIDRFNLHGVHFSEDQRRRHPEKISRLRQERPQCRLSSAVHRLEALPAIGDGFDYLLLSPVFDSISKPGYRAAFAHDRLQRSLRRTDQAVMALGGVDADRIATTAMLGFDGVAVLGAVWRSAAPEAAARRLARACRAVAERSDQADAAT